MRKAMLLVLLFIFLGDLCARHMRHEVELKIRLQDNDFDVLQEWLQKEATFCSADQHVEYYFTVNQSSVKNPLYRILVTKPLARSKDLVRKGVVSILSVASTSGVSQGQSVAVGVNDVDTVLDIFDCLGVFGIVQHRNKKNREEVSVFDVTQGPTSTMLVPAGAAGYQDLIKTLRVRITSSYHLLCLKEVVSKPNDNKILHRRLYTSEVNDGYKMVEIIKMLGFNEVHEIRKHRKIYMHGDIEITIDEVEGLGKFIEAELKYDEDDAVRGERLIGQFFKQRGINQCLKYDVGYAQMVYNPGYEFGQPYTFVS